MKQSKIGLRIIGGYKLLTVLLLVGLGVGLFRQLGADPGERGRRSSPP